MDLSIRLYTWWNGQLIGEDEFGNRYYQEKRSKKGIIFEDMPQAVIKYPELVKKYFMKLVPANDHMFAALHGAVWS